MTEQVRTMFSRIAPSYDKMNNVLSFGIHHLWRRKAVRLSGVKPGDKVLDCATGTGGLAFKFSKITDENGSVTGLDFSSEMIYIAKQKYSNINFITGDVMNLGFEDNTFDISSISFGIRNVDSPLQGLSEMARVVKPGGRVVVIEFGQPRGMWSLLYNFYSKRLIPLLGKIFAQETEAYIYLPETASKFPCRESFTEIMNETGRLKDCRYYSLSGGIAFIYTGIVK